MKPIPARAMPVVEVLRRDVPRPKSLPVFISKAEALSSRAVYVAKMQFLRSHTGGIRSKRKTPAMQ